MHFGCGLFTSCVKEKDQVGLSGLSGEPPHRTSRLTESSPPQSPPREAGNATTGHKGQPGACTSGDNYTGTCTTNNSQRWSQRSQDYVSSNHHYRRSRHRLLPRVAPAGAHEILKSIGLRPVLGAHPSTTCDLDQLLHDLRYSLHPNAMSVMSLATVMTEDPHPPLALAPPLHSSPHTATTISVNQAFELLVGAAGLAACGAADSYIERLLSQHPEARSSFCQKVALALTGHRAGACAPDIPSIDIEAVVEGQMSSLTLTVLPFTASRTTLPSAMEKGSAIAATDLTITPAAAGVFPALFVELRAELALQLAVQRSSVCMATYKDPVTMLTMDGHHILWQNHASEVRACRCL